MTDQEWNELTYGERAWKLGLVMMYMNDEETYYGPWLYIWPDGEDYQSCLEDFANEELYKELEESFISHYSVVESHDAGLYSIRTMPVEVIKVAHYWDHKLNLPEIKVLK